MQVDEGTCQDIYYTVCKAIDHAKRGEAYEVEEEG